MLIYCSVLLMVNVLLCSVRVLYNVYGYYIYTDTLDTNNSAIGLPQLYNGNSGVPVPHCVSGYILSSFSGYFLSSVSVTENEQEH